MRVLFLLLALVCSSVSASAQTADLLLVNGRIYTLDVAKPWADAIAIAGDRIVAVGSTAEISARRGTATRVIDLKGRWIMRGDWGAYEQWSAGSAGAPASANQAGPFTPGRDLLTR